MKKYLFTLILAAVALSAYSQAISEALYIYRNDGQFNAFYRGQVQSIEYSDIDLDGVKYNEMVTQIITTADSVYRIPLAVIDSVSFVNPETTYKEDVKQLGIALLDYIVSVDDMNVTFRSDTPNDMLPQVGDKVATVDLTDIFPYGFLGKVHERETTASGVMVKCDKLALEDVVSRFYGIYQFENCQESNAPRRASYTQRLLPIKDLKPIKETYEIPSTMVECKDVMSYSGQAKYEKSVTPNVDIILTVAIDDQKDILSYNAKINNIVEITDELNVVGAVSKEAKHTLFSQDFPLIWGLTFYFDLGLKAELGGELAFGYNLTNVLHSGLDVTFYPKKPLDSKQVQWHYQKSGDKNLRYLAGSVTGKLGGYFGMGLGVVNHGLAKFGCEFELGVKGTAEFKLNLDELADNHKSTSYYDNCKDQKADLSLYLGTYLVTSLFEGDNQMIDDYVGNTGWWDKFSVKFSWGQDWNIAKLYEGYMLPQFEHVALLRNENNKTMADASYLIPYNSIQKCKIGFRLFNSEGQCVDTKFYPEYYSNKIESAPLYPLTFTGLNAKDVYTLYPFINVLGYDMLASPKFSEDMVLLVLNDANEVEYKSAKLSGRVVANSGRTDLQVCFEFAKVPKLITEKEEWNTLDAIYDEEQNNYFLTLSGLTPACEYKFRMKCNSYGEEIVSEEKTFTTKVYQVTVNEVTVKTPYSATLSGQIQGYDPKQGFVYFNYTTDWTSGSWNEVDAHYDAASGLFTTKLTGLNPATRYFFKLIYVIYEDKYESVPFGFTTNDLATELPVMFSFQQTSSSYTPSGYSYKGNLYSFEYGAAVTCQWVEAENVGDFGYVYEDFKGDTAHVSLKAFESPYTDTRYVYYRNEPKSKAKFYTYIQYQGDDVYYHTEKNDYELLYDKVPKPVTLLPTETNATSAKVKCAYQEVAPWGGICGIEYWEDTNISTSKKIFFETAQKEMEITLSNLTPSTVYYYQAIVKVDDKYVGVEGIDKNEIMAEEIKSFTTLALNPDALCPDDNHPHLIDLGLPSGTKWACCNVGASKPEAYGGYYMWGEVEERSSYGYKTYAYYTGLTSSGHPTCSNIGSNISMTSHDVAYVKWGNSWHMPTHTQMEELLSNTTQTLTKYNGVDGFMVKGTNGAKIFFPEAGCRYGNDPLNDGASGNYWSSSSSSDSCDAKFMYMMWNGVIKTGDDRRYVGNSVRPVAK